MTPAVLGWLTLLGLVLSAAWPSLIDHILHRRAPELAARWALIRLPSEKLPRRSRSTSGYRQEARPPGGPLGGHAILNSPPGYGVRVEVDSRGTGATAKGWGTTLRFHAIEDTDGVSLEVRLAPPDGSGFILGPALLVALGTYLVVGLPRGLSFGLFRSRLLIKLLGQQRNIDRVTGEALRLLSDHQRGVSPRVRVEFVETEDQADDDAGQRKMKR